MRGATSATHSLRNSTLPTVSHHSCGCATRAKPPQQFHVLRVLTVPSQHLVRDLSLSRKIRLQSQ
eukprot:238034-Prymnesium_polylepis.1